MPLLQCVNFPVAERDLFSSNRTVDDAPKADRQAGQRQAPLAARMRPRTLEEYAGQQHILKPGMLLRRAIEADRIQSLIFYGPPGTGKTTLAQIIANRTESKFERLSGVESNVAEMRVLSGPLIDSGTPAGRRCFLLTRFIASTKRNRTYSCPTWKAALFDSLVPPRIIRFSVNFRSYRAHRFSSCSRWMNWMSGNCSIAP